MQGHVPQQEAVMAVLQTKDNTHIVNLRGGYLVCDVCHELQIALGLQGDVTLVIA